MRVRARAITRTDVVVVGGGPAGCAAAIAARGAGARVVLLERETVARDRPGETLAPGVEPLLDWLGVGDVLASATLVRHEGHWVDSAGGRRYVAFGGDTTGAWRGFQVWRRTLDTALRQRAADLGVDVRLATAARGVLRDDRAEVRGVACGEGMPVRAGVVIDAAGGRHWLARELGLGVARLSPRYVATYGYACHPERSEGSAVMRSNGNLPSEPLFSLDPDGWTWVAPLGERGWAWTTLSFGGKKPPRGWSPPVLRGLGATHASRGADVTWRIARALAGRRWLIAGDAGAVLDPAASHGVLRAVMSGARAGLAAAGVRQNRSALPASFAEFDAWFRGGVVRDAEVLRNSYAEAVRGEERRTG